MALTLTPSVSGSVGGRAVGGVATAKETVDDSTSTAVPPATTTYTNPGLLARVFAVTFDSSYATGGEALVAADLGLSSITDVLCTLAVKSDGSDAYLTEFDHTNNKLLAYRDAATATTMGQVPNTTDLSAYTCRLLVLGHP